MRREFHTSCNLPRQSCCLCCIKCFYRLYMLVHVNKKDEINSVKTNMTKYTSNRDIEIKTYYIQHYCHCCFRHVCGTIVIRIISQIISQISVCLHVIMITLYCIYHKNDDKVNKLINYKFNI